MKLEMKHLAAYLPYGLKYQLPLESERFDSILENEPFRLAIGFLSEEEEKRYLLPYKKMFLQQKQPSIAWDDNRLFLGQMQSSLGFEEDDVYLNEVKPILRPLSDLTKPEFYEMIKEWYKGTADNEISIISRADSSGSCTVMVCYKMMGEPFTDSIFSRNSVENTPYWIVENLLENHFDIHGLIEQNLAIDINTLNQESWN